MRAYIRRCAECLRCRTRYLLGFSPYRNGAYLVPTIPGSFDEYTLYCSCCSPAATGIWKWSDMRFYAVAKSAHHRGYGSFEEIVLVRNQARRALEGSGVSTD